MQKYIEKKIEGIDCLVNSDLARAMENDKHTVYLVECYIRDLKKEIDPDDINLDTAEFETETSFINRMVFVIRGSVILEGKDEDGWPKSWHLNESAGLQIRRVR